MVDQPASKTRRFHITFFTRPLCRWERRTPFRDLLRSFARSTQEQPRKEGKREETSPAFNDEEKDRRPATSSAAGEQQQQPLDTKDLCSKDLFRLSVGLLSTLCGG
jgi:hypothetical protein